VRRIWRFGTFYRLTNSKPSSTREGLEGKCHCRKPHSSVYGGDDGARTRDLCRDSGEKSRMLLKTVAPDDTERALRNPLEPLLHPYRTHDRCPFDLCLFTQMAFLRDFR